MSKLVYPAEGVSNYTNAHIASCQSNLQNALNNCQFSIPNGFAYTNSINELYSIINSYIKEIRDIKTKIKDTDTRLDNLDESLSRNINQVPNTIIEENNRLIKF